MGKAKTVKSLSVRHPRERGPHVEFIRDSRELSRGEFGYAKQRGLTPCSVAFGPKQLSEGKTIYSGVDDPNDSREDFLAWDEDILRLAAVRDHPRYWLKDGKPYSITLEPYSVLIGDLVQLDEVCNDFGLLARISGESEWCPGMCLFIEILRDGTEARHSH